MRLHRQACEYYTLDITTEPAVTGAWAASFDDGATWVDGEADGPGWRWLVAGPDATEATGAVVVAGTVKPLIRHDSTPERIIQDVGVPAINVFP